MFQPKGQKMTIKKRNLEKKLTEYNKKPKMSKKTERKVKRQVRRLRKAVRAQHIMEMQPQFDLLDEELERQRIIREVEMMEGGESEET
jgi:acetylglutamate kinase